jgi:hypothetical protein
MINMQKAPGGGVIIGEDEYDELQRKAAILDGLEALGVDNWNGYSDGHKWARENYPELFEGED